MLFYGTSINSCTNIAGVMIQIYKIFYTTANVIETLVAMFIKYFIKLRINSIYNKTYCSYHFYSFYHYEFFLKRSWEILMQKYYKSISEAIVPLVVQVHFLSFAFQHE